MKLDLLERGMLLGGGLVLATFVVGSLIATYGTFLMIFTVPLGLAVSCLAVRVLQWAVRGYTVD